MIHHPNSAFGIPDRWHLIMISHLPLYRRLVAEKGDKKEEEIFLLYFLRPGTTRR